MRDFLPDDVRRRTHVIDVIAGVYQRYGFEPLETPAVENIETLMGKYGEEGDRLIFKILRRGDEGQARGDADLALRYDLTVPLARVVAEYRGKLPRYFKRYQVQPVWRADRPQKGRFREFYQCDVDIVGSRSMVVEAELCAAVSDVLGELGFNDFVIRVNDRRVLTGVLRAAGVETSLHGAALVALDKLDKVGPGGVARELADRGIAASGADALLGFFSEVGPTDGGGNVDRNQTVLAALRTILSGTGGERGAGSSGFTIGEPSGADITPPHGDALLSETSAAVPGSAMAAVDDLDLIVRLCAATSAAPHVRLDPSLARGLSYYTGAIMEIAVADLAGSLGGGGRYDDLVGMFLGERVPACGFSLGLERILVVMGERGMFPPEVAATPADVLVTLWSADRAADGLELAAALRAAGLRVDVYPDADKLGKQFKYAASRRIPYVAVVGDDEAARGQVTVKNMNTGEQQSVARSEAAGLIGRP
jgi:histidyl-tRNA synthetase